MEDRCPVCRERLEQPITSAGDGSFYMCSRCGRFTLTGSLEVTLPHLLAADADTSAKLSHYIRRSQVPNRSVTLDTYSVAAILKTPLPRPREQADLFIRWLAENVPGPGEKVDVASNTHGAIIGSKSSDGFGLIVKHLLRSGLVVGEEYVDLGNGYKAFVTLSFDGWEYYENLREGVGAYRKAFMAMKYGDAQLDEILGRVFKPCAKQAGFDLLRLDDSPRAGLIDDRLRVEIQNADFVIADLTHDNLGAYWEAGYAEGLGKPVIYACEKQKFEERKTHFDTNHHLTILWDSGAPEEAGENLKATIRATLPHLAKQSDKED